MLPLLPTQRGFSAPFSREIIKFHNPSWLWSLPTSTRAKKDPDEEPKRPGKEHEQRDQATGLTPPLRVPMCPNRTQKRENQHKETATELQEIPIMVHCLILPVENTINK
jgi:hypothetical protein